MFSWNQRWINSRGNSGLTLFIGFDLFADSQQFDDVAVLTRAGNLLRSDFGDSLTVNLVQFNLGVESQRSQNRNLLRCVIAFNVELGICFQVTKVGGLDHCGFKRQAIGVHAVEDIVCRTIDDSHNSGHLVAGKRFPQWADNRNCGGHGSLIVKLSTNLLGNFKKFTGVSRQKSFVRGNHIGTSQ